MSSSYFLSRVLRGVLTVVVVTIIIFFMLRFAPADPAVMLAGEDATEEQIQEIRELWGLDKPIWEQFVIYVRSLMTGDAGMSFQYAITSPIYSVVDLVKLRLPNTIKLAFTSVLFSVLLAVPIGIFCGLKPGSWFDHCVSSVGFFLNSFPNFFIGMILILVFGLWLNVLPTGGADKPGAVILPAFTLSLHFAVTLTKMTRTQFIHVLSSNYIRTTRAKGLKESAVLFIHGLRNVAIPLVTLIGLRIGTVLGGSVVTEMLFRWPGIGHLLMTSLEARDYPTVQFLVPYIALIFVVINLLVDLLYGVLDPRVSHSK